MLLCFIYFDGAEIKDTTTSRDRRINMPLNKNIQSQLSYEPIVSYLSLRVRHKACCRYSDAGTIVDIAKCGGSK